jgi:hypothetical protein
LDLERRGFIVYIVCNTIEEEVLVQNESRPDIKPLMIDIVDVSFSCPASHYHAILIYFYSPTVLVPLSTASQRTSNHPTPPSKERAPTT